MVRYFCNKCDKEIKNKMLRVSTADETGEKTSYHLCYSCALQFVNFMKLDEKEDCETEEKESTVELVKQEPFVEGDAIKQEEDKEVELKEKVIAASSKRQGKYITPETRAYIEKYMDKKSAKELSNELGIPYPSVYQCIRVIKKNNFGEVKPASSGSLTAQEVGTCIALRRAGWSIKDISYEISKDEKEIKEALAANNM